MDGDHARTVTNIAAHAMLLRLGIVSVLVICASVLVASWSLHAILRRVSPGLALLALLFRAAEAIVGFATMLTSLAIVQVLDPRGPASDIDAAGLAAPVGVLLALRTAALDVVLSLIGVGGTLFFVLFWRARCLPRVLSLWGIFIYLSMLGLALVSLVYVDHPRLLETVLYGLGALFEGVFALWMLIRGVDTTGWRAEGLSR